MFRVAVTGGIAEGKSTVTGYLRDLGYEVASSDEIARQVFQRSDVQQQLAQLVGAQPPVSPEVLRAALKDHAVRRQVNAITHPLIVSAIRESSARVVEVPLLVETCLQGVFDRVWVVTCGEEEQLRRLSERLSSASAARELIGTQLTSRVKIAFADRIVRTNQPEITVKRFVTEAATVDLR